MFSQYVPMFVIQLQSHVLTIYVAHWASPQLAPRLLAGFVSTPSPGDHVSVRHCILATLSPSADASLELSYSHVQARKIFLTTYYDPFNPELYRYLVKPDTTPRAIPSCPPWTVFTAFSSLQRAGFKGLAADAWASVTCSISSSIQSFWSGFSHAQDPIPYSWPPT